jgi:hypothetical protein
LFCWNCNHNCTSLSLIDETSNCPSLICSRNHILQTDPFFCFNIESGTVVFIKSTIESSFFFNSTLITVFAYLLQFWRDSWIIRYKLIFTEFLLYPILPESMDTNLAGKVFFLLFKLSTIATKLLINSDFSLFKSCEISRISCSIFFQFR